MSKLKYTLKVDVQFDLDQNSETFDSDVETLERNLDLLPEMARDLGLFVDGLESGELLDMNYEVKKASNRGRKRKTA